LAKAENMELASLQPPNQLTYYSLKKIENYCHLRCISSF
jgi:hypothetical protein